jgi:hypothetical protein
MKSILFAAVLLLSFASCKKGLDLQSRMKDNTPVNQYVEYVISQGTQSASQNAYKAVNASEMNFTVKFDQTAVYQTKLTENQGDINKLYGFSDNNQEHHQNSARFGWRWYNNKLEILAYVYNNSVMSYKYLGTVAIGTEANCRIKVAGNQYVFTLNGTQTTMPRASATELGVGYQLYPYFGGDELAPHDIHVWVKNL